MSAAHDTTSAAEQVRVAAIRGMSPVARLHQVFELSESVRRVALSTLRLRHPDYTDVELVELFLGERLLPSATRQPRL